MPSCTATTSGTVQHWHVDMHPCIRLPCRTRARLTGIAQLRRRSSAEARQQQSAAEQIASDSLISIEMQLGLNISALICRRYVALQSKQHAWRQLTSMTGLGLQVVSSPAPAYASTVGM